MALFERVLFSHSPLFHMPCLAESHTYRTGVSALATTTCLLYPSWPPPPLRYSGFRRLALKNVRYGAGEVLRSAFSRLQVAQLRRYVPDITAADIVRWVPSGTRTEHWHETF